ncbi:MAG TPA: hypothetical protein VME66_15800 [Candidatus Acidoferrales bacterium]|nr:hypothetical protein [Candidatus Acidoferrales bacterium]
MMRVRGILFSVVLLSSTVVAVDLMARKNVVRHHGHHVHTIPTLTLGSIAPSLILLVWCSAIALIALAIATWERAAPVI